MDSTANTEPIKARTRGVLLIALGKSIYWQMASNLAWAIKVTSGKRIPVTLVCTNGIREAIDKARCGAHFDNYTIVPDDYHLYKDIPSFGRVKCGMYELSPYDDTIFIDVDTIWFPGKNVETLFNELGAEKGNVLWQNSGTANVRIEAAKNGRIEWFDAKDVLNRFEWKNEWLARVHSYFIYFRKSAEAENYFKHSIIAHDRIFNERIPIRGWHSGVADEAAFSIASGTSGLYLAGGLAPVAGEKDRHWFSPLFQHSESKMEDAFRIEQRGFYGATTTLDKCGANWIQNYEITYRKIFQSGGAGRLFDWRNKK